MRRRTSNELIGLAQPERVAWVADLQAHGLRVLVRCLEPVPEVSPRRTIELCTEPLGDDTAERALLDLANDQEAQRLWRAAAEAFAGAVRMRRARGVASVIP